MKTRSCKAKGRRLQQYVRDELRKRLVGQEAPDRGADGKFVNEDIESRQMGGSGVDIILSPSAQREIPYDIECKNTETASVWAWLAQAEANARPGRIPLVVFKRNSSKAYAIIEFEKLLEREWRDA